MQAFQTFLDIRISFLCRSTHTNEEGKNPIVLRVSYRSERRDIFTGLFCFKKDWLPALGRVSGKEKYVQAVNQNLEAIQYKAKECFDELKFSGEPFTIDELVSKIKGQEEAPQTLMEYINLRVQEFEKRVNSDLAITTFYKYKRVKRYMEEFLMTKRRIRNIAVVRVDSSFLQQFFQFLRKEKANSHNSALTLFKTLKAILRTPIKKGVIKDDPFEELGIKGKPVYKDYLTKEEIENIVKLLFDSEPLERSRDIFLFACYTGLAYLDIYQLNGSNLVKNNDGTYHIRKNRQKTGIISIIPLIPAAERILKKYSLTGKVEDFKWYVPTNQKLNLNLKKIGKMAGIEKKLHMHLARHSFATTVTLSNGVPMETVSRMMGHSSTKITQHYAKVLAEKISMDMEKVKIAFG